jgi:AbrB family looped-hinge helix DNA binding protein
MSVVTVKNKYQVVIPQNIRRQLPLEVGDLLEASVKNGKITLTPKSLVDRHLAEGLADLRHGRSHGPYKTAVEAIQALESRRKRQPRKRVS